MREGRTGRAPLLVLAGALVATGLLPPTASYAATTRHTGSVDAQGTAAQVVPLVLAQAGPVVVDVSWALGTTDLNVFVKGPSGAPVASSTSRSARPEHLAFAATTPGTYRITVNAVTGAADYALVATYPGPEAPVRPRWAASLGGGTAGHPLFSASGLDLDPAGNTYLADTGDDQVEKWGPSGEQLWSVGTHGPRALGRFDNPRDVAYLDGRVYVADTGYARVQVLDADDPTGTPPTAWSHRFGTVMGISAGTDALGAPVLLVSEASTSTVHMFTPSGTLLRTFGLGPGTGDGQLLDVRDADTDAAGNVYVADYTNDRIATFSPTGAWLRNFGVRGTGPGQLKRPYGVEVGDGGSVYVADGNDEIDEYDRRGVLLRTYGSRGTGPGQFSYMRRVAVADGPAPRVCGADLWAHRVLCFTRDGTPALHLDGGSAAPGSFNEPYGLAVDSSVFVMDTSNQRTQVFDTATGSFSYLFGERGGDDDGFNWSRDLTLVGGAAGTVWVADTKNSRLTEFTRAGSPTGRRLGSPGSTKPEQLDWPFAVASYDGDLVVADSKNHRVLRWDPDAPSPTWVATGFRNPQDVTVAGGRVYVADTENHRVVVLSAQDGSVVAPSLGADVLHAAEGIAVDPAGRIWVADTSYHRLVQLSSTGELLQTYGRAGEAHGRFNRPTHLEVLPGSGATPDRLYVADMWNDRIEVFDLS